MNSLRVKLLLCFLVTSFTIWAMLSIWAYTTTRAIVEEQTLSVYRSTIEVETHSADINITKVEMVADLIGNLQDMEQYLSGSFTSPYDEYRIAQNMLTHLENLLRGMGIPATLTIVSHDSDVKEIIPIDVENMIRTSAHQNTYLDAQGQVSIALYQAKRFQPNTVSGAPTNWYVDATYGIYGWRQTQLDVQQGSISLIKPLPASPFSSSHGVIKISMRLADIVTGVASDQQVYVFDQNHHPIIVDLTEEIPEIEPSKEAYSTMIVGNNVILSGKMRNGWRQYHVQPYDVMELFEIIQFQFLLLLVLSLALSLGFSAFFSGWFVRRIHAVRVSLHRFEMGHYDHRITVTGSDEIDMLATGYNNMAEHTNRLVHDVYQTEIRSQRERLTMLQSQIRPHFLYNSLSAIVRLCDRNDVLLIKEMAQALVRFYRISLSKGQEEILLQEEIDHISAYVQVCSIRHRDKFTMTYQIDEKAKRCYVPKIILQPFVENALEHGMDPTLGVLHISIIARVDDGALTVEITDDGIGIENDRLEQIQNDEITTGNGYGISNVRERIRITYGDSWGVSLRPNVPHGLTAQLMMEARESIFPGFVP